MFVCICDFCACVCVYDCACVCACVVGVLLRRLCVKLYHVFFFNHWKRQQFCMLFMSFVSFYKLLYSAPFVSGSLSLSLTFFLSGFSLLCVILRNTHIHTCILQYIYMYLLFFYFLTVAIAIPPVYSDLHIILSEISGVFNMQFKGQWHEQLTQLFNLS